MPTTQCVDDHVLAAFARGNLPEAEIEAVAAHLDDCSRCRRRMETDAGEGAFDDDLRWARAVEQRTHVDIGVPLQRLNELLTDYELLGEIGRGGMGIVYRARHKKLNRQVALKVLPALLGAVRPDAVARFAREAELAARLEHTNIVGVYDFGEVDGTFYYAMQLIEGRSLRDIVHEINETGAINVVVGAASGSDRGSAKDDVRALEATPTSIGSSTATDRAYFRRVAGWIADVAEALQYAHDRGVIHRDIKPSNLLLSVDNRLMIADFGLARDESHATLTATRSVLGTARYVSPEVLVDDDPIFDQRVDVYALGATLYELLAFRPMFAAATDREVLNQVLNVEPTPPRRFVPHVPRELEIICLKSIEKNPSNRYATAQEFADDLRRWLLGVPIHARRAGWPTRTVKFVRRHRFATALTIFLIAFLSTTGTLWSRSRSLQDQATTAATKASDLDAELSFVKILEMRRKGQFVEGLTAVDAALARNPDAFNLHRLRAMLLINLRRLDEARQVLGVINAKAPDDWNTHYTLGNLFDGLGDTAAAAPHLRRLTELMPDSAEAFFVQACDEEDHQRVLQLLDRCLDLAPMKPECLDQRATTLYAQGRYEEMLRDVEHLIALSPAWGRNHGLRGAALNGLGRQREAEQAFDQAIEFDPRDPELWCNRGCVKFSMGRAAEALADAEQSLRIDPEYAQGYIARSFARKAVGDVSGAESDINRAIELAPMNPQAYIERAVFHGNSGRFTEALRDSTRALELTSAPSLVATVHRIRAVAYRELKRHSEAIAELDAFLKYQPNDAAAFRTKAGAYMDSGRYDEAIAELTRALEIEPEFTPSLHDRANCYVLANRWDMAVEDYKQIIAQHPRVAAGFKDRAAAYMQLGDDANAQADLDRYVQLSVESPEALLHRAASLIRMGRAQQALVDLDRVVGAQPDNSAALFRIGIAHELLGHPEEAIAAYSRVERLGGQLAESTHLWIALASASPALPFNLDLDERTEFWSRRLTEFGSGRLSADELLTSAVSDTQRAEAYYYCGRIALANADHERAISALESCVRLRQDILLETDFAYALLWLLRSDAVPANLRPSSPVLRGSD